jgi:hypothetical protein
MTCTSVLRDRRKNMKFWEVGRLHEVVQKPRSRYPVARGTVISRVEMESMESLG